jgi:hypothetical protein
MDGTIVVSLERYCQDGVVQSYGFALLDEYAANYNKIDTI